MFRSATQRGMVCAAAFCCAAHLNAQELDTHIHAFSRSVFGPSAQTAPLALAATNLTVTAVTLDGQPAGWVFRTDQVPPACKGKRGQIAILVALDTRAQIKEVSLLSHKEDMKYFGRIKKAFYAQFSGRHAASDYSQIDAVTQATLSSRAIIRDIMEGSRNVAALPEIASLLTDGPPLLGDLVTKTPAP